MAYALAARLERAVKNAGVKYRKVSGWASRGHGTMGSIQSVIVHHTAGPKSGNSPSLNVVAYGRPGLSGPLAQLFLARDGTVYLVAAGISYHAGRVSSNRYANSHAIGIEAEATGLDSWPAHQIEEYAKLCKALCKEFGLSVSRVQGHKEVAVPRGRKPDPNFNMSSFRAKVGGAKGGVSSGGGSTGGGSSKKYTVVSKTAPLGLYDRDGNGHTRIEDWQKNALGYSGKKADGFFGPDTESDTKKLQKQIGLKGKDVDGVVGPATEAAWLKAGKPKLKKAATPKPAPKPKPVTSAPKFPYGKYHYIGRESNSPYSHSGALAKDEPHVRKWQQRMKDRGWNISVDGYFGAGSERVAKQFQRQIGVLVDGKVGKVTFTKSWTAPIT